MKINNKGFAFLEAILVIIVIGLIGAVGWLVWNGQQKKSNNAISTEKVSQSSENTELKEYKVENEGLIFNYNPSISVIEPSETTSDNGTYVEKLNVNTGDVSLSITAGVDGIGGQPACTNNEDRDKCTVLETKKSTFLGSPVTYRLVKTETVQECGFDGAPACDVAPLTTSFIIDTGDSTEAYGACCGTISQKARNTNKKANTTGSLLITIVPLEKARNKDLFSNKDLLETVKIIESMRY